MKNLSVKDAFSLFIKDLKEKYSTSIKIKEDKTEKISFKKIVPTKFFKAHKDD